jgi:Xaa-Pro dipeptidase
MKAFEIASKSLRDGMTHGEFGGKISAAHQQLGTRGGALVLFAEYSALPHGTITPQKLKQGDVVLMDGGCSVEGYASDITRTTVFGKPSDKQRRVWDIVKASQAAALKVARPGAACEDVDAAARKVITDAGFGPGYKYFTHRLGHGIGMDGHEWSYLVRGNKTMLEAGMSFSNEPGIYIPGEFGIRLEDIMVITESGADLLTGQAPSIDNPYS